MRKLLSIVVGLVLVSAVVAAQHSNMKETPLKADLSLSADVQFGPNLLKAGDYKVKCDRETITFSLADSGKKVLEVPCKGREMKEASTVTEVHITMQPSGVRKCDNMLLKGSPIEHVF